MNLISSPHEKRYRKGASLSPSEFLYLHRHIFSCVYCTVTGGDSLGTLTPPHSAEGPRVGAPGTSGFWDIRLSEIGVGRALGPVEPELDCKSGSWAQRRLRVPPSWNLGSSEGPSPVLCKAHPCKEQSYQRDPATDLSRP